MSDATWRNWSRLVSCAPASIETARDVDGVVRVVRECAQQGSRLRVVGSGHSFTPLVATSGKLLSLDGLSGLEAVDRGGPLATVLAGTRLHALGPLLEAEGLALENMGDIDVQSLGGSIGTGTHGTGITLGNLSTQVTALTLVTGDGEVVECSEQRDRDVFKAAQVSLGALGVVVKARLRLMPAYRLRYERRRESFDACAARAADYRRDHRHFEAYWFPHTDTVQVKLMDPTDEPARGSRIVRAFDDLVMENAAFGLLCRACRAWPTLTRPTSRLCAALVSEGVRVDASYRTFATRRMVRFYEMEYALPAERGLEALGELKAWIASRRILVHFPVELRFVKGDDIPLSPSFGRDTAYLAVHMYRGMPYEEYFAGAERIFRRHDGRPHWGKMHGLAAPELRTLYPKWDSFHAVRRRLDPHGIFMNPYLGQLFEG